MPATVTATRDQVLASRTGEFDGYSATSDTRASYAILGATRHGDGSVFAVSRRTGQLVMVTRTGSGTVRGRGSQVRVRISFAEDTGDAAGTLAFQQRHGVGGVAPLGLFGDVPLA